MKRINLKQYFSTFEARMKSFLVITMFLFFTMYFVFGDMSKLNYLMYPPAGLIAILCFIYYFKKKQIPNFRPLICIYVFVGIAYLVSLIANPIAALTYKTLFVLAIFSTAIYLGCSIINNKKVIMLSLSIAGLIFSLAFAIVYFKDIIRLDFSERLGGVFGNVNDVGLRFVIIAALLSTFIIYYTKQYWLLILILPILFFALLTGSRKVLIASVAVIIFAIFLLFRKKIKIAIIISCSAVVVFSLLIFFVPAFDIIKERFISWIQYKKGEGSDGSAFLRYLYKNTAYYLSFKNLFLGYGVDGFDVASGYGTYSHDNISELICNFGLFGLISFYGMFVYTFKNIKFKKFFEDGSIIYFALVFLYCILSTGNIFYYDKSAYLLTSICLFINQTNAIEKAKKTIEI